jgi:hypothetical protein
MEVLLQVVLLVREAVLVQPETGRRELVPAMRELVTVTQELAPETGPQVLVLAMQEPVPATQERELVLAMEQLELVLLPEMQQTSRIP